MSQPVTKPNMEYSVFSRTNNDATQEPIFLGQPVNVQRYDQQKYEIFSKLTEKQISFFWRPEEIDVSRDRLDFASLPDNEKHIFTSNLKYQTLLDSIQGRSPSQVFESLVSIPELEEFIAWWVAFEVNHSKSYTHIIRNVYANPSEVLDDIVENPAILKRTEEISKYYDSLYEYAMYYNLFGYGTHTIRKNVGTPEAVEFTVNITKEELARLLYLCLVVVNVLEGVRFYGSFLCSYAFAERELMEGNAKIIKLINRYH